MAKSFVSNKILFLYLNLRQKAELQKCEKVLKSVFRKFRKSAVFSYMQIDVSPSCLDLFTQRLYKEIQNNDAVFIVGDIPVSEKNIVLRDMLGEYAEAHYLKSCVICHPSSSFNVVSNDSDIICTHTVRHRDLEKAVNTATMLSLGRKRKITVCTEECMGPFLKNAVLDAYDKSLHLEREYLTFEEVLFICMNSIPAFDVVLTTEQAATTMRMHIGYTGGFCSTPVPDGYSVIYTKKGKVYTRQTFPYEQINNTVLFSSLLAFSAILEKEFSMKSAADWLKKASSISFETHKTADADDFINKVILEIEKPMRKHAR